MKIDDKPISRPPYAGPKTLESKEISQEEMDALVSRLFGVSESQEKEKEK